MDQCTPLVQSCKCPEELTRVGEHDLLHGRLKEALEAFQEAETLSNETRPDLLYRQSLALFEYSTEEGQEEALSLANKSFKKTHLLDPTCVDSLHAWGNLLTYMGEHHQQPHFFEFAEEKYAKILELGVENPDLFWDLAVVWYHIGDYSGEAVDLQKSLAFFEKAQATQETFPSEFWADYGAAALLQSRRVQDMRLVAKAIHCFKYGTNLNKSCFDSWSCLSEALHIQYLHSHEEDHFSDANQSFDTASKLAPQDSEHLLDYAKFLLQSARKSGDVKRLRQCLEKCQLSYAYDCENVFVLAIWAEALALLGQITERLDLIYEAENKISEALEFQEEDPEIWYSLGMCFCSFGKYFNDYDYYYQAIEKFQTGLSLDRSCTHLWHEMANTYNIVGFMEENLDTMMQALKFYEKAISLEDSSTLRFDYASCLSKIGEVTRDEGWIQQALWNFEAALAIQKNALYLHPQWLFSYATTLDMMGDFHEDEKYYTRAIEIFTHVLMVDPEFPNLHHRIAQAFCHLGELQGHPEHFHRAIHHLRFAQKHDEESDAVILDWGIALIHIAQYTSIASHVEEILADAEQKLTKAAKLGNIQGYYHLACLYSLMEECEKSMYFLLKSDYFNALPDLDELLADDWLDNLRSTSDFQAFIAEHPHLHKE